MFTLTSATLSVLFLPFILSQPQTYLPLHLFPFRPLSPSSTLPPSLLFLSPSLFSLPLSPFFPLPRSVSQALKVIDEYYTIDRPTIRIPLTLSRSLTILTDKVATTLQTGVATRADINSEQHSSVQLALMLSRQGLELSSSYNLNQNHSNNHHQNHHQSHHHNNRGLLPLPVIPGLDGLEKLREAAQWTWEHDRASFARYGEGYGW